MSQQKSYSYGEIQIAITSYIRDFIQHDLLGFEEDESDYIIRVPKSMVIEEYLENSGD